MDNPITPEKQNVILETALRTYPIVPMPRDITTNVLSRIQTIPTPRPFRLTWNDVLLGLILSLCVGAIWFGFDNLPPLVIAQIRKESILLYQHLLVNARWLLPALSFGLAAFFAALTLPFLRRELIE